jgi:hypothetical protein
MKAAIIAECVALSVPSAGTAHATERYRFVVLISFSPSMVITAIHSFAENRRSVALPPFGKRYTEAANRKRLAEQGAEKLKARTKVTNLETRFVNQEKKP